MRYCVYKVLFGICAIMIPIALVEAQSQQPTTQVSVDGSQITVSSTVGILSNIETTDEMIARFQEAVEDVYNSEQSLYKCYNLNFDIDVQNIADIPAEQDAHVITVININNAEAAAAYDQYGLYNVHLWDVYDVLHPTEPDRSEQCSTYHGLEYDVECAELSQWFSEYGLSDGGATLGYASSTESVDFDGSGESKTGVVASSSSTQLLAHEIGHILGFVHETGDQNLMDPEVGVEHTDVTQSNLHDAVSRMNLECRWDMELNNIDVSTVPQITCPNPQCQIDRYLTAYSHWQVESAGLSVDGTGTTTIDTITAQGCGCNADIVSNGDLQLTGYILNNNEDSTLVAEVFGEQSFGHAYTMDLTTSYTTPPQEDFCAPEPTQILQYTMSGGGFDNFQVDLGNPENNRQVLQPVTVDFEESNEYACAIISSSLTSDDLVITNVEAFQREYDNNFPHFSNFLEETYGITLE